MEIVFAFNSDHVFIVSGKSRNGNYFASSECDMDLFKQINLHLRAYKQGLIPDEVFRRYEFLITGVWIEDSTNWVLQSMYMPTDVTFFSCPVSERYPFWRDAVRTNSQARKSWLGFERHGLSAETEIIDFMGWSSLVKIAADNLIQDYENEQRYVHRAQTRASLLTLLKDNNLRYLNTTNWQDKPDPRTWSIEECKNCFETHFKKWVINWDSRQDNRQALLQQLADMGISTDHLRDNDCMDALLWDQANTKLWSYTGD